MKEITIAGIPVSELKRQREIIQKDASAFIAENLETAHAIITKLANSEEGDDVEAMAKEAVELYKAVEIVAGVSGVTYYLPFSEEWGYDETPFSIVLEEHFGEGVYASRKNPLSELHSTLESMEYTSRKWNSSSRKWNSSSRKWNSSSC